MAVDGNLHLSFAADGDEHLVAHFTLTHNGVSVRKRFNLNSPIGVTIFAYEGRDPSKSPIVLRGSLPNLRQSRSDR
jgi:hypothetical protein